MQSDNRSPRLSQSHSPGATDSAVNCDGKGQLVTLIAPLTNNLQALQVPRRPSSHFLPAQAGM